MRYEAKTTKYLDSIVVIFAVAVLLFVPPVIAFWATSESPWYLPYALWLAIIVLVALVQRAHGRHEL